MGRFCVWKWAIFSDKVGDEKGRLAEWSNAPHLKCGMPETASEVRILHLPLAYSSAAKSCHSTVFQPWAKKPFALKGARGFESHPHRQLGNEAIGSPATRARQPFFAENSSRFEFNIKFEPTFLRNARICVLSPCDKRILAWLLNKITSRIGSSQLFPFCSKSLISCSISAFSPMPGAEKLS